MPANAATVSARTSANAGSAGVSVLRAARARPRKAGAPDGPRRDAQQPAQHERVDPQHHDHRRDGDQDRGGARVKVDARARVPCPAGGTRRSRPTAAATRVTSATSRTRPRGWRRPARPAARQPVLPGRDQGRPADRDRPEWRPAATSRPPTRRKPRPAPGTARTARATAITAAGTQSEPPPRRPWRGSPASSDAPRARTTRELRRPAQRDHPRGEQQHRQARHRQAHVEQPEQRVHRLRGREERRQGGQQVRGRRSACVAIGRDVARQRRGLRGDRGQRVAQRLRLLPRDRAELQREPPLHRRARSGRSPAAPRPPRPARRSPPPTQYGGGDAVALPCRSGTAGAASAVQNEEPGSVGATIPLTWRVIVASVRSSGPVPGRPPPSTPPAGRTWPPSAVSPPPA